MHVPAIRKQTHAEKDIALLSKAKPHFINRIQELQSTLLPIFCY